MTREYALQDDASKAWERLLVGFTEGQAGISPACRAGYRDDLRQNVGRARWYSCSPVLLYHGRRGDEGRIPDRRDVFAEGRR